MKDNFNDGFMKNGGTAGLLEDIFSGMFADPYVHTGASISNIINESAQLAQESPEIENHKTYIVSFPARIVTVVTIDKGMMTCFDKGYVDKKAS